MEKNIATRDGKVDYGPDNYFTVDDMFESDESTTEGAIITGRLNDKPADTVSVSKNQTTLNMLKTFKSIICFYLYGL